MPTVGQINAKISELRSKIAVYEGLVHYLKTNYLPSDHSDAEMSFTRTDFVRVPPPHIEASMADLVEKVDQLRVEMEKWEEMPVSLEPEDAAAVPAVQTFDTVPPKPAPKLVPPTPLPKKDDKKKESTSGTTGTGKDQPAPVKAAAGKAG